MVFDVEEAVCRGCLADLLGYFHARGERGRRGEERGEGDDGKLGGEGIARWVGEDGASYRAVA